MGVEIIICHIDLHSKETCFYFHGLIVSATTLTEILTIYIIFFAKKMYKYKTYVLIVSCSHTLPPSTTATFL